MTKEKSIAVVSMVRNDSFFADKWITYYGSQFGYDNLYLFVDGMDQKLPSLSKKINCLSGSSYRIQTCQRGSKESPEHFKICTRVVPELSARVGNGY